MQITKELQAALLHRTEDLIRNVGKPSAMYSDNCLVQKRRRLQRALQLYTFLRTATTMQHVTNAFEAAKRDLKHPDDQPYLQRIEALISSQNKCAML